MEVFSLYATAARGGEEAIKKLVKSYEKQAGIDTRLSESQFLRKYSQGI